MVKDAGNPLITVDGGLLTVYKTGGSYRMWYMGAIERSAGVYDDCLSYATSPDGLVWTLPALGTYPGAATRSGISNTPYARAAGVSVNSPLVFPAIPNSGAPSALYTWFMSYRRNSGCWMIGSTDGLTWDEANERNIHSVPSDFQNVALQIPGTTGYQFFVRKRDVYGVFTAEPIINDGQQRRLAITNLASLWSLSTQPVSQILDADAADYALGNFRHFYNAPMKRHESGLIICWLGLFNLNDTVVAQVIWSVDGYHWYRQAVRSETLSLGGPGTFDEYMVFPQPGWVEEGNQWRVYYTGWDMPHSTPARLPGEAIPSVTKRNPRVGLATLRKGGVASYRFPGGAPAGGVVSSRTLVWPGGGLYVNANGNGTGQIQARVLDPSRRWPLNGSTFGPLPNFDWSTAFTGDSTKVELTWPSADIRTLAGQQIRIEFFGDNAMDFFSYEAAP